MPNEPTPAVATPDPMPSPDGPGVIEKALVYVFGKSWKTALAGAVGIACAALPMIHGVPQQWIDIARVVGPLVMSGGLFVAKDHNVTGKS